MATNQETQRPNQKSETSNMKGSSAQKGAKIGTDTTDLESIGAKANQSEDRGSLDQRKGASQGDIGRGQVGKNAEQSLNKDEQLASTDMDSDMQPELDSDDQVGNTQNTRVNKTKGDRH